MKFMLAVVALAITLSFVAATAPLLNAGLKNNIQDQYLVVFHKNSTVQIRDAHVAELRGNRFVRKNYERIINTFDIGTLIGYSAILDKMTLVQELEHPNVLYVEADQVVTINEDTTLVQTGATWGLDRVDQQFLPLDGKFQYWGSQGTGVTAYVIDTGIMLTHNEFGGRAKWGFNAIAGEGENDGNGHGTHVAGTIGGTTYGLAKNVTLVAVKVLSAGGSGSWAGVISGVDWVTKDHAASTTKRSVANMSLGGGITPTLDTAVEQSVVQGVNHVVAAGNNAADACNFSPARAPSAITVGATSRDDYRAYFSNTGTCLDVFAPGDAITSAWIGNNAATNTISGTSMASPHVAGAVALYLGHAANVTTDPKLPIPTPIDVVNALREGATPDVVRDVGANSPNRLLFAQHSEVIPDWAF